MMVARNLFRKKPSFVRGPATWLAYLMLTFYAFLAGMLGPLMPFLRADLNLSYTLGGLHLSAVSVGIILAGLTAERIAQRLGRKFVLWGGGSGASVGLFCLATARTITLTIPAALVLGYCGALVQVMVQAILSDQHGDQRAIALTEANIGASIGSALAPMFIGLFERVGVGWRGALYLGIGIVGLIAVRFFRVVIPDARQIYGKDEAGKEHRWVDSGEAVQRAKPVKNTGGSIRGLPRTFWAYWAVICLGVAIEWCLSIWSADFMEKVVGLSRVNAATTLSIFFGAAIVGRVVGNRLTWVLPAETSLLIALGITAVGFPLFWLAPVSLLNLAGLFIAGFGVANFFPLAMTSAISQAPKQANVASARVLLGVGLAVFIGPLVLGWIADAVGIFKAYGILPGLIVLAVAITFTTNRLLEK